eukprot:2764620-Pleurochrysis_carterae.AAC.1
MNSATFTKIIRTEYATDFRKGGHARVGVDKVKTTAAGLLNYVRKMQGDKQATDPVAEAHVAEAPVAAPVAASTVEAALCGGHVDAEPLVVSQAAPVLAACPNAVVVDGLETGMNADQNEDIETAGDADAVLEQDGHLAI